MQEIKIFSPATVANVNCGFDTLGFALHDIGDEMILRKIPERGIKIVNITGADLPLETSKNVAGVAGLALLEHLNLDYGFEIEIKKNLRIGGGLGSSAASAAGVVFGINQFLKNPLSLEELTYYGMKGEAVASGNEHADNLAPSIFGGFTLITSYNPFHVVQLPLPSDLYVTIIQPHIEVKTKDAREILPEKVLLKDAIEQSGNLAGFISGLYTEDYKLLAESLKDVLVEPYRKSLIPLFKQAKDQAIKNNSLGFGISGSGPSMFALCKGEETAKNVQKALNKVYNDSEININSYVSKISDVGCKIIS